MVTIKSSFLTTLAINQDRRVVDMADKIFLLEPDKTPLTTLLMRLRKMPAKNPKYQWPEDVLFPRFARVEGAHSSTDVTIVVEAGQGAQFKAGDIIRVTATSEVMSVTGVNTDTLTVVRGWGSTDAQALTDAMEIVNLGNASPEGSNAPTSKTTQTTTVFNYSEIIRTPFEAARTLNQSATYGGPERAYRRMKHGIEHMVDIERKLWFGVRHEDASAVRRTTGGILQFVTSNVKTFSTAGLTESSMEDFARDVFRYGSSTKFLFCSPLAISKINLIAQNRLQLIPADQTYGITIHRWLTGHGILNVIRNVNFEGDTYDELMVALDLENTGLKVMQDTFLNTNIHLPDFDGWKDEYLSELGLVLRLEKTHGVAWNVGGSAV